MKKTLTLLAIAFAFSAATFATDRSAVVNIHQIDDQTKTLTIDLYNITNYSIKNLEARINTVTKNFFSDESSTYIIVIKASLNPTKVKQENLEISPLSFQIKIKGTLAEVKKELETIGATIDEMRKPVE